MHKIKALCKCPQISYLPFCDVREKFRRVLRHSTGNCDEHICSHEELETAGWGLLFKTRQNKSKQTKPTCHGYLSKNHKGEEVSSLVTIKAIFPLILGITVNIQNHHPCPKQTLLCVLLTLQVQRPSRQLCHLLRVSIKEEQEQTAAKVSEEDLGSDHMQMADIILQHHHHLPPPCHLPGACGP